MKGWTLSQDGWRGLLVLLSVPLFLLIAGWRPLGQAGGSPSIVMSSVLLDADLPGTRPHDHPAAATERLRQSARAHGLRCGAVEVYRVTRPGVLHTALEDAQAEQLYLRFKDRVNPALSRWEGLNRLWMVEGRDELLLCLLDAPLEG